MTATDGVSHAVCLDCYPGGIKPGVTAVCGQTIDNPRETETDHCVICTGLEEIHAAWHTWKRGASGA